MAGNIPGFVEKLLAAALHERQGLLHRPPHRGRPDVGRCCARHPQEQNKSKIPESHCILFFESLGSSRLPQYLYDLGMAFLLCPVDRCTAIQTFEIYVRALIDQCPNDPRIQRARSGRLDQGCIAHGIFAVETGASIEQKPHDLQVAVVGCQMQGCITSACLRIYVRAFGQKQLDSFDILSLGCNDQGCKADIRCCPHFLHVLPDRRD